METNGFINNRTLSPGKHRFLYALDTHEHFLQMQKIFGSEWKYNHTEIIYNINSNYFRNCAFSKVDWENAIVVVGCSYIFGEGVIDQETIPAYIGKLTGRPVVNLGCPGISNEGIFYNTLNIQKYKPFKTYVFWTHKERAVYRYNNSTNLYNPTKTQVGGYNIDLTDYFLHTEDIDFKFNLYKKYLAEYPTNNIVQSDMLIHAELRKVWYEWGDETGQHLKFMGDDKKLITEMDFVNNCLARDIDIQPHRVSSHFGPWVNKYFAKKMLANDKT